MQSTRMTASQDNIFLSIQKSAALASILIIMSGCGADSENLTKKEELEDRMALQSNLQPVIGNYSGKIEERPDGSDPFPVELSVFVVEEENGVNDEGEPQFRPSLRARYRRTDLLNEGLGERTLRVRYYRERSEIAGTTTAANAGNRNLPDSQLLSFTGKVDNDVLDLEFRDHRGILGYARLQKSEPH